MTINNIANNQLSTSMMRISTGQRINSARDDAAGLAIAERMTAQIRGLDRGTQNVMDMQNLVMTAEGGLNNIGDNLQRIRELTVQSLNGVLTDNDRQNIQHEIDQLISEIDATTQRTEFNTMRLLDGSFNREDGRGLHTAAGPDGRGPSVYIGNMSSSMLLGPEPYDLIADASRSVRTVTVPEGAPGIEMPEIDPPGDGYIGITPPIGELEPGTVIGVLPPQPLQSDLLRRVDDAITRVSRERSYLGAMHNRFDTTIASNQIANLNLAASRSRIADADIAQETMNMIQARIQEQAEIAMQRRQQEQMEMPLLSLI